MNQRKKKAFTLTELLVVVVIIGVLAAVVLPKFHKVIETRKTTEAEEVMAAVRTEQERRCALEKPYIGNIEKLVTNQVLPQTETKNYTYSLESTGILASSRNKPYNLKMPSYADGRICCDGEECSKLNKEYLSCTELQAKPDYQVATECMAPQGAVCEDGEEKTDTCNDCGTHVTERCVQGRWTVVDEPCSKTVEECTGKPCEQNYLTYCGYSGNFESTSWPWKSHPKEWYKGKTWRDNPTECCDPREQCPETCEPGKVKIAEYKRYDDSLCCATPCPKESEDPEKNKRTSNEYAEFGACWVGDCRDVCGGTGYGCPKINESLTEELKASGKNRKTQYEAALTAKFTWEQSKTECYKCPTDRNFNDPYSYAEYRDDSDRTIILNERFDKNTCSIAAGCPEGYTQKMESDGKPFVYGYGYNYVCEKNRHFSPKEHKRKGVVVLGTSYISEVGKNVKWFTEGTVTKVGDCLRLKNATEVGGIDLGSYSTSCDTYGGPEGFCKAICDTVSCRKATCYPGQVAPVTIPSGSSLATGVKTVPDSCCKSDPPNDLSLSSPFATGCKQMSTVEELSVHYYTCEPTDD